LPKASEKDKKEPDATGIDYQFNHKTSHEQTHDSFTTQECNVIAFNYAKNHLNNNYKMEYMYRQPSTSVYSFSNSNSHQKTKITVNEDGTVNAHAGNNQ